MIRITALCFTTDRFHGRSPEPWKVHVAVITRSRWCPWRWVLETDFMHFLPGERFDWCAVRLGTQVLEGNGYCWEVQMQRIDRQS